MAVTGWADFLIVGILSSNFPFDHKEDLINLLL
jgi:hypothetical protein